MDDGDGSARLQRELLLCWLAQTVAQVAERAAVARGVSAVAFACVGPRDSLLLSTTRSLARLVTAFTSVSVSVTWQTRGGGAPLRVDCEDVVSVDALEQAARPQAGGGVERRMLVVLARGVNNQSSNSSAALRAAGFDLAMTVTSVDVGDLEAGGWPWRCTLTSLTHRPNEEDELLFLRHPLEQLEVQCGWRVALEVLSWIPSRGDASIPASNGAEHSIEPLFTTASQLPFQLVLLLLRWSFFHPSVARILGKKLRRQLELTPAARTRRDVWAAQRLGQQLWAHLYPDEPQVSLSARTAASAPSTPASSTASAVEKLSPPPALPALPGLDRLSKCQLWDAQKQFYLDRGIQAWSSGVVPFGVSSSSFIAATYARVAVDFLLSQDADPRDQRGGHEPNCFVWEAASGSCKFLHHFLLHFYAQVERHAAAFQRKRLVPLVVASDLSEQVLNSRMSMACFQSFLQQGKLEFARFDTASFVSGPNAQQLRFKRSNHVWCPGSNGPLFLMGNYFFDSLRTDVFALTKEPSGVSSACSTGECDESISASSSPAEVCFVHEAAIDPTTSSIAEMDLIFRAPIKVTDKDSTAFFSDAASNAVFRRIVDEFRKGDSSDADHQRSALVLFPTEAVSFLSALIENSTGGSASRHAIALIAGDAGFSFRDAIPNVFLTDRGAEAQSDASIGAFSLELPQLSPHPDCFCLPVDFEVFQFVIEALGITKTKGAVSTTAQTASTLASDTFDVFYATLTPTPPARASEPFRDLVTGRSHCSFRHELAVFTPGDCDLLWGMMSIDDGARHLSTDTLLVLLAQTSWDFDLFAAVQWPLLHRWRRQLAHGVEPLSSQLIAAGVQSWRTYYEVEGSSGGDGDGTSESDRLVLQVARWFFVLQAYEVVLDVLSHWESADHQDEANISAAYLLGLTHARLHNHWKALALFRKCARLKPTRIKFQTRTASALLELQHLRHGPQS